MSLSGQGTPGSLLIPAGLEGGSNTQLTTGSTLDVGCPTQGLPPLCSVPREVCPTVTGDHAPYKESLSVAAVVVGLQEASSL